MNILQKALFTGIAIAGCSSQVCAAQIGIADFGINTNLETYTGLPLIVFSPGNTNPTPLVIGGNTYSTDDNSIRYGLDLLLTNTDLGFIDILFGTPVNKAGISAGTATGITWKVEFFVAGSLLASVTQSTLAAGMLFTGWDAGTEKITSLRVTDLSDNGLTIRVDDLRTEISPVPLPAALPLLAAGLGAMGFMGWRRKRKATA